MRMALLGLVAVLVAGAAAPAQWTVPVGGRVTTSGRLTVETAPNSPAPRRAAPGAGNGLTYYAELAGVSNQEAERRLAEQGLLRPAFMRLMQTIRTKERGNYTEAELVHRPDWAYVIYFKRAPAATLARYTKNPRFKARSAKYTRGELEQLTRPWIMRLNAERLTTGYGMNARHGTADVDMVVSAEEFAAIARAKGWGPVPDTLNLKFDTAPVGVAVDPRIAPGIRIFAQGDRNLGATNQAALGGRIVLRDGCFFVIGHQGSEQLAYFAREVGLGLDQQGYLALHRRTVERPHLGRIGESFTWAGPIGIDESAPMVGELRARCGKAPLMHVGVPDSSAMFNARYGLPRPSAPTPPLPQPAPPSSR